MIILLAVSILFGAGLLTKVDGPKEPAKQQTIEYIKELEHE